MRLLPGYPWWPLCITPMQQLNHQPNDQSTVLSCSRPPPQDVRIPPGPRLLILAHIDQYRHILRPAMPVPKALPHE